MTFERIATIAFAIGLIGAVAFVLSLRELDSLLNRVLV